MKPLLIITGPTASGKTKLAAHLAYALSGEIISADSRQVFKRMNIGTGKDYQDYVVDGAPVPYHLIDIKEPGEEYSVTEYMEDFDDALRDIQHRHKQAILCGGTGFYISGALQGFERTMVPPDEVLRERIKDWTKEELLKELSRYPTLPNVDQNSRKRLMRALEISIYQSKYGLPEKSTNVIPHVMFGLDLPREIRRERISARLKARIDEGLVQEVQQLLLDGVPEQMLNRYGLEYRFTCEFLQGRYDFDTYYGLLEVAIHQFAKRQMTWFRKMEKDGFQIRWLNAMDPIEESVLKILASLQRF